jgi:lactoylglutathione lyase
MSDMLRLFLIAALGSALGATELPISGIASAGFRVSDLDRARAFYGGVLGYEEAFRVERPGESPIHYFKVNDSQFIEITPDLGPDEEERLAYIGIETPDAAGLRRLLAERGLEPTALRREADGNRSFTLRDPDGHLLRFVEYLPGSPAAESRGRHLSERRLSTHLRHVGIAVADETRAMAFYRDTLGFVEIWRGGSEPGRTQWVNMRMPGARGDYVEYMLHTGRPTRDQLGSMHHICLEVPDIQAAWRAAIERGVPDAERFRPRVGRIRKWLFNLFDADGTRTELMEPTTVD